MDPLKEMFNQKFFSRLAKELHTEDPNFNSAAFMKDIMKDLESLSLNQRMRYCSLTLHKYLKGDFKEQVKLMSAVIQNMPRGYTNLLFPDYVSLYGLDDFATSMKALAHFTKYGSSEYAIRVFLKQDFEKTIKQMETWAKDKNEHVRRLASEGSRPRLPWSFKLDRVIEEPLVTKAILDKLCSDESLYVRKSVANHLNDFARSHPDYLLEVVSAWDAKNADTAWIIKHACRTLIKQGNQKSMGLFGFQNDAKISVNNLHLSHKKLKLGETLEFSFELKSDTDNLQKLVVDYAVYYPKKTSKISEKVFKLKVLELQAHQTVNITKRQVFKDFTTRTHSAGLHKLEILVNGKKYATGNFEIII